MSRIPYVTTAHFTDAQHRLFEHITQGKRGEGSSVQAFLTPEGGLRGPFNALMYSPEVGDMVQRLGAAVRYGTSLPPRSRELAILMVAAKWKSQFEWWAHARIAKTEGLPEHIIENIKSDRPPELTDPIESVVFRFVQETIAKNYVSEVLYKEAVQRLGEAGVVELVILVGYYYLIATVLNVFKVPLPAGEQAPFRESG
jgi:4-carboxymuconolactone decarboxylase